MFTTQNVKDKDIPMENCRTEAVVVFSEVVVSFLEPVFSQNTTASPCNTEPHSLLTLTPPLCTLQYNINLDNTMKLCDLSLELSGV